MVERRGVDVDFVGRIFGTVAKRGAALRAEPALHTQRRMVQPQFALPLQVDAAHGKPGDERRSAGLAAGCAVAMGNMVRLAAKTVTNRTAQTSALHHAPLLSINHPLSHYSQVTARTKVLHCKMPAACPK